MDVQTATPPPGKQTKLIAALLISFGLLHCASLLVALLPGDWKVNQIFAPYRQLTGTQQEWEMFATIPIALDKRITVDVTDTNGKVTTVGPILPGLEEFDIHTNIRYYSSLVRMMSRDSDFLGAYVGQLKRAVKESSATGVREFSVKTETDFIRLIKNVQKDGQMTLRKTDALGPIPMSEQH
jgi:hypothetical protein